MRPLILATLWLAVPLAAPAQAPAIVPLTAEPSHHLALTTDYVRVFDVTAAPHATTLVHRHDNDYLFVTLGDADITSARTDAPPAHLVLKDGALEYARGAFAHAVTNNIDRPFHNITIEILHPSTGVTVCTTACARPKPCAAGAPCATVTRSISADQWVGNTVTLPAGATWTADSGWSPALAVVVSEADLELAGEYESTADRHRTPGNLIWMPVRTGRRARPGEAVMRAVSPAITNVGAGTVVLTIIEWNRQGPATRDQ
jgi:hypothetical protein